MKEIKELNNLLSKYVDQGFFPGIQWQININNDTYAGKYGLNNIVKCNGYRHWLFDRNLEDTKEECNEENSKKKERKWIFAFRFL